MFIDVIWDQVVKNLDYRLFLIQFMEIEGYATSNQWLNIQQ